MLRNEWSWGSSDRYTENDTQARNNIESIQNDGPTIRSTPTMGKLTAKTICCIANDGPVIRCVRALPIQAKLAQPSFSGGLSSYSQPYSVYPTDFHHYMDRILPLLVSNPYTQKAQC